jgi:hypothetical protein
MLGIDMGDKYGSFTETMKVVFGGAFGGMMAQTIQYPLPKQLVAGLGIFLIAYLVMYLINHIQEHHSRVVDEG